MVLPPSHPVVHGVTTITIVHRCQMRFDVVQVVFVATANQLQNMSAPLLDRLEIIQLSGYTLEEKRHIAEVTVSPALPDLHKPAAIPTMRH